MPTSTLPHTGVADDNSAAPVTSASSRALYSIGAVARMLSIAPATLRTWEDRYSLVVPQRSAGGHRLYSRDQVEQLRFVKRELEAGLQPSDAHRLLSERLERGEPGDAGGSRAAPQRSVILVADDDSFDAMVTQFYLRREGYETVTSAIGETEDRSEELCPALAVVAVDDIGNGDLALFGRLRMRGVPAILAVSASDLGEPALFAGADAFLAKPLGAHRLAATVETLLDGRAALG